MFDSDELRKLATDERYSAVRVGSLELLSLLDEYERLRVENEKMANDLINGDASDGYRCAVCEESRKRGDFASCTAADKLGKELEK